MRFCWCPELNDDGAPCRVAAEIRREWWQQDTEGRWLHMFEIHCLVHRSLTPMGWQVVEMD